RRALSMPVAPGVAPTRQEAKGGVAVYFRGDEPPTVHPQASGRARPAGGAAGGVGADGEPHAGGHGREGHADPDGNVHDGGHPADRCVAVPGRLRRRPRTVAAAGRADGAGLRLLCARHPAAGGTGAAAGAAGVAAGTAREPQLRTRDANAAQSARPGLPGPPPSCPEAHVRLIRAAPAPRVRTFAYLLEQNMPISFRRAPRAPRPCVAVLAALSLSATAFAGAAPGHRPPPDARTLDAVEVQGHRSPIDAERALTPGGVSVVDGDSFHLRPVTNLADALRYVPGVWVESSTGGDAVFLSSRGSNLDATGYDRNGVKLFQDGLPVSTADGNNHNRFLDPVAARHVVVARGANALTYGASNLGGAIDFITPTARNSPPAQAAFAAGSHGLWSGRLTAGGVSGDLDGMLTLEALGRDGHREHSRQDRAGLYANAGWRATPALELRLFASYIDSEEELAGGLTRAQSDADPYQANPSAVSGNFQLDVRSRRLAGKAEWDPGDGRRLEAGLSWEEQHLYHPIVDKVMVDLDGPGPMPPVEVFSLLKMTD